MRLIDAEGQLIKLEEIPAGAIMWIKAVYDVDLLERGGWMFQGEWIDSRLQDNINAPCPVICKVEYLDKRDFVVEEYHLLGLEQDGTFREIVIASGKDWSYTLLPFILNYFQDMDDAKKAEVTVSGEALTDAKWIKSMMAGDKATLDNAVAFALKFTREAWTKNLGSIIQPKNKNP